MQRIGGQLLGARSRAAAENKHRHKDKNKNGNKLPAMQGPAKAPNKDGGETGRKAEVDGRPLCHLCCSCARRLVAEAGAGDRGSGLRGSSSDRNTSSATTS